MKLRDKNLKDLLEHKLEHNFPLYSSSRQINVLLRKKGIVCRNSLSEDDYGNLFHKALGNWIFRRTNYFKYSMQKIHGCHSIT